jgi:hypothetical protein
MVESAPFPLYGWLRREGSVEGRAGTAEKAEILRPVQLTLIPYVVGSIHEVATREGKRALHTDVKSSPGIGCCT